MTVRPDGRQSIGVCVAFLTITTIFTLARLYVRFKLKQRVLMTDYFGIAGWLVFAGYCGLVIGAIVNYGGTVNIYILDLHNSNGVFKALTASELVYIICLTLIKLSVLFFYLHVFAVRRFRVRVYAVMSIAMAWAVATLLMTIFSCTPPRAVWDIVAYTKASCLAYPKEVFGLEFSNIVIDMIILALPLDELRRLQMRTGRKIAVAGALLLGGGVVITSICRISFLYSSTSVKAKSWDKATDWSTVQQGSAVICACLPVLPPLLPERARHWMRGRTTKRNQGTSRGYGRALDGSSTGNSKGKAQSTLDEFGDDIHLNQVDSATIRRDIVIERTLTVRSSTDLSGK